MEMRSYGQGYAKLSSGQVQCMLMVSDHLTSKQIAQRLGISPHTVDQRIRRILRITGAPSRRHAARLVRERIEREHAACPSRPDHVQSGTGLARPLEEVPRGSLRLELPFATRPGQVNVMGIAQRLFWIVAIAFTAMASTAMYLAGLESLGRVIQTH